MIMADSKIQTATTGAQGGDISFHIDSAANYVRLQNSSITTSVKAADGDGGEINLGAKFVVMGNGKIIAQAVSGDGGNIDITTKSIFRFDPKLSSIIDASSRFGTSGIVTINAPDVDLSKELLVLNAGLLDVSDQVLPPCEAKHATNSTLRAAMQRPGVPSAIDDWQAGLLKAIDGEPSRRGQFSQAVEAWLKALPDASDTEQLALLGKIASAYQQLGMHSDALLTLGAALENAETRQDTQAQTLILSQLSDVWLSLGDWDAAKNFVEQALQLARAEQAPELLAYATNAEGNMLASGFYYLEAFEAYQEAADFATQAQAPELSVAIGLNALFASLDETGGDVTQFDKIWQQTQALPDSSVKARYLISLGVFIESYLTQRLEEQQQPASADLLQRLAHAYRQAGKMAEQLGDARTASLAYGRWGRWYDTEDRIDDALLLLRKAIFFAEQGYNPDILYQWQRYLGQALVGKDQLEAAIQAYLRAIDVLQPIQHFLTVGYRQPVADFERAVRPVYYELAELLLEKAARTDDKTQQQALLLDVRNWLERLKAAELENVLQDDCLAKYENPPTVLEGVLQGAAVIYPVPLDNYLVLLVSRQGEIHRVDVDVSRAELSQAAIDLQALLQTRPI